MKEGKLIVLEGACDGIGKTTQFDLLWKHLEDDGIEIHHHHFPTYNTYQGAPVERYLAGDFGEPKELSPYFIHSLYAQDRAITWLTKLKPQYEKGKILLMDRYTTSSLLYQSANISDINVKKDFLDFVCDYEYNKLGIKEPDRVLFLYASFNLITEMRNKRVDNAGIKQDIHEVDFEYMKRVYDNAMFVADYLNWEMVNCEKNNHMRTIEDIHEDVYSLIKKYRGN